jgi:branched-chain amino acid aminotransferase
MGGEKMSNLVVRKIELTGRQLFGTRNGIKDCPAQIAHNIGLQLGVNYHVLKNDQPGIISGRLDDLPYAVFDHTLTPDSFKQGHVRRSDRRIAELILEAHPQALDRFKPIETTPIDWQKLPFALNPSRAMFFARMPRGGDWSSSIRNFDDAIYPFGDFLISPASIVLSYGPSGFEGMKAYRTVNGDIVGFRWEENAKRLGKTVARLAMTPASVNFYLKAVVETVLANIEYVPPPGMKAALYIRPVHFGIGEGLGVQPASEEAVYVFVSPVGPYFKTGFKPINLRVEEEYHRAGPGGTGHIKAAGNYVMGMLPEIMAKDAGFAGILWLDAVQSIYVEEVGAANFFYFKGDTLFTPELGTILPGITRDSVIQLARAFGYTAVEEKVSISDAVQAEEAFCTGTAAVISPVGSITYRGETSIFNNGKVGSKTQKLYNALVAIQEDRFDDESLNGINQEELERFKNEWIYKIKQ